MELNDKETKTYEIIGKVINGEMTRKEAQFELDKSRQQIYRLILIYLKEGKEGFIHKNRGKVSKNKIDKNIIEELEQLYIDEYYDYNFEHFFEEIKDRYNISYPSLHRVFLEWISIHQLF